MDCRYKKKEKNEIWVLVVIFLCFVALPIYLLVQGSNTKKSMDSYTYSIKTAYKIESSKTGNKTSRMYKPVYYYNVFDKEYTCTSSFSSNQKPNNKPRKIYYYSNSPNDCYIEESAGEIGFILLILALGLVGFIAGVRKK